MTGRLIALFIFAAQATAQEPLIEPFSALPIGELRGGSWEYKAIPKAKRTHFAVVDDDVSRVLRIDARASAGALLHRLGVTIQPTTRLRWRWKIIQPNPLTRMDRKSGDDFPVRIYVLFDYDAKKLGLIDRLKLRIARSLYGESVPAAALCYVWDQSLPVGSSGWNPYSDRVRMIVASSGESNSWEEVERSPFDDFRSAFGESPPPLSAILVGGDSDNTGESTVAYLSDLGIALR